MGQQWQAMALSAPVHDDPGWERLERKTNIAKTIFLDDANFLGGFPSW